MARERIFIKTLSTESRWVIGPENILYAGACVHLSNPEILQAGAVKGLNSGGYIHVQQNLEKDHLPSSFVDALRSGV